MRTKSGEHTDAPDPVSGVNAQDSALLEAGPAQRATLQIPFQGAPQTARSQILIRDSPSFFAGQSTLLCPCAPHWLHVPLKNLPLPAQSGFLCPCSPHWFQFPSMCRCLIGCLLLSLASCLFLSLLDLSLPLPFFPLPHGAGHRHPAAQRLKDSFQLLWG